MAGVASNHAIALYMIAIDCLHHMDHLAGSILLDLVILFKCSPDMAILATDAQSVLKILHGSGQLIRRQPLQRLNVLINLFHFFAGATGAVACACTISFCVPSIANI